MESVLISTTWRTFLWFGRHPSQSPLNRRRSSLRLRLRRRRRFTAVAAQGSNQQEQQQLNLSVLRFTFGIPGLDESYLPRWIGVACGSLIILNHFLPPSAASTTPAQLRSEALGLCLAAFSAALPYLGKFLEGADPVDRSSIQEGNKQIFVMSENLSVAQKVDFAWGSYVLLRNTNTMSVLIAVQDALCVRGYWNTPEDVSKAQILEWFKTQIKQMGFLDLKDALYFPQSTDSQLRGMLPKGALSLLLQPIFGASDLATNVTTKIEGFVLLASSANYAYSDRDRAWVRAIANKFQGKNAFSNFQGIETSQ